jgi:hypothetical protein
MLECVQASGAAETSITDNLKTYVLVEAAYEAAATGRTTAPRL